MLLESGSGQFQRFGRKQWIGAFSALWVVGQALGRDSVYRIAMRADDMHAFTHNEFSQSVLHDFAYIVAENSLFKPKLHSGNFFDKSPVNKKYMLSSVLAIKVA